MQDTTDLMIEEPKVLQDRLKALREELDAIDAISDDR